MPELPEVETVVRQLSQTLPGRRILEVEVIHPDLLREASESFRRDIRGSKIQSVGRRGKNILLALSGPRFLSVNLGMTGQLLIAPHPGGIGEGGSLGTPPHPVVLFTLDPPGSLLFADTRRFGCLRLWTPEAWEAESARLGPEPLDRGLTPRDFHRLLARSRSPIRSWLLDQTHIVGIGNIYASEVLFRVGIHPKRPARSVDRIESGRLLKAVRAVLTEAIRARGTTLRDFRTATGDRGAFEPSLQAYGRAGMPCPRCNTPIERIVFGNRSAFFCPCCQPLEYREKA
jgi:formamidopyrimidine-DNA glycosylase